MVVNDEIITNENQPEVIQPPEVKKSHLIYIEENSTNSNDNQLEVIVPIGIVNSPSIPRVSNNDKNSSPGSIDSAKIITYHQPHKFLAPVKMNWRAMQKRLVCLSPIPVKIA